MTLGSTFFVLMIAGPKRASLFFDRRKDLVRLLKSEWVRADLPFVVSVALVGATTDLGGALYVFPTALSRPAGVLHLVLEVLRLWLILSVFVACIVRIALAAARRFVTEDVIPTGASIATAFVVSATLTGISTRFVLSLMDQSKLEFPGIGVLFESLVLAGSFAFAIGLFFVVWAALRSKLQARVALAKALLFGLSLLSVSIGVIAVHLAVAPVYEHRVALLVAISGLTAALFLRELVRSSARAGEASHQFNRWFALVCLVVVASWPFSQNPHSRFVLFGHVPVAGSVGVFVRAFTDWDEDGAGPWYLGGADCAPTDGNVAPGLNEIAGDGIDQDCRGGDAPLGQTMPLVPLAPSCTPRKQKAVNVVLITVDALRADKIRPEFAPFLFRLRNFAQYYERAYAPSGSTSGSVLGIFSGEALSDMNSKGLTSPLPLRELETIPLKFSSRNQSVALLNLFALNPQINRVADLNALPWSDPSTQETKRSLFAAAMVRTLLDFTLHRHERPSFAWAHIPDLHAPYALKSNDPAISNYDRALLHVDAQLERFYSALANAKKLEETLVIITSDHGEQLGERGREGHGTLFFEEGLRVPLFVLAPNCAPNWNRQPVSLRSIFELVIAYGSEGRRLRQDSLTHLPNQEPPVVVEEAMLTALGIKRAFIGTRFKVIDDVANGGQMAFDLQNDPGELTNISGEAIPGLAVFEALAQRWLDSPAQR